MKPSGKVIVVIAIVAILACGGLWAQHSASTPKAIKLTAHDMEVLVGNVVPAGQQEQLASDPEQKKQLAKRIKQLLAVGQAAESEGYAQHPDLQSQLAIQADVDLSGAFRKKHPDAKVTDEEVAAYHTSNPNDFESFVKSNPRLQQAQGPQRDDMKKQFGEIRVLGARARKEGLDQEDATRIQLLLDRSQALAQAYVGDLQKDADKLVTDGDIAQYYNDHAAEFEEVHARHILISTQPQAPGEDADDEKDDKKADKKGADKKPKVLSDDEARKKAQALLERVHKGEDFTKLAQENSDEPGAKTRGGDLGYFTRGKMVGPFEEVAFKLKPGEVSDLVKTQFGYHIIKVEDHRTAAVGDAKTREEITNKLKEKKLEDRIEQITNASSVQVAEDFNLTPKAGSEPEGAGAPPAGEDR